MLGFEYQFTRKLVAAFFFVPPGQKPLVTRVEWDPIMAELDKRVAARKLQAAMELHRRELAKQEALRKVLEDKALKQIKTDSGPGTFEL